MTYYREVQQFRQWWLWALLAFMPALSGWGLVQQVVLGKPWGSKPAPDYIVITIFALTLALAVWFWNLRLIVEVKDRTLEFIFLFLWRRRKIQLAGIDRAEAVTYRPLLEYGNPRKPVTVHSITNSRACR